jgi:hypothetical protein
MDERDDYADPDSRRRDARTLAWLKWVWLFAWTAFFLVILCLIALWYAGLVRM